MKEFSEIIEKGKEKLAEGVNNVQSSILEKTDLFVLKKELKVKESELVNLYADYGKACYNDCQREDIKEAIDLQLEYIKEIEAKIDELSSAKSDSVFCTKCGKECDSEDEFCPKCGTRLKK